MDDQKTDESNKNSDAPVETVSPALPPAERPKTSFEKVERLTAIVLMTSGILFAIIGIASVWGAFGDNGDIIWRSLGSLAIIALTALVVNVGARMVDGKK